MVQSSKAGQRRQCEGLGCLEIRHNRTKRFPAHQQAFDRADLPLPVGEQSGPPVRTTNGLTSSTAGAGLGPTTSQRLAPLTGVPAPGWRPINKHHPLSRVPYLWATAQHSRPARPSHALKGGCLIASQSNPQLAITDQLTLEIKKPDRPFQRAGPPPTSWLKPRSTGPAPGLQKSPPCRSQAASAQATEAQGSRIIASAWPPSGFGCGTAGLLEREVFARKPIRRRERRRSPNSARAGGPQ